MEARSGLWRRSQQKRSGTMPESPKHAPGSWPTSSETCPLSGRKPPKARPVPCPCAVHPVAIPFIVWSFFLSAQPFNGWNMWGIVALLRPVPCPSAVHPVSIRCPSPVHPGLFLSILPFWVWKNVGNPVQNVGNPVHPAPASGLCIILREERADPRQPGARRGVHTGGRRVALLEFYRRSKSKENFAPV